MAASSPLSTEIRLTGMASWLARLLGFLSPTRRRRRRPAFKSIYELDQRQPIREFEKKMARGMLREGREVFVTAFCNDAQVLGVTATIGTKYRCAPSDDVFGWGDKCLLLGATQIRQYHNHHSAQNGFGFSRQDRRSHLSLKKVLEPYGLRFESHLVCPGLLWGYRIKRFSRWESFLAWLGS